MGWRKALLATWSVDPVTVTERIPTDLVVDTFDGSAVASKSALS